MFHKPNRASIGRLAERQPDLLNPLVAFFVMGWQRVNTQNLHGVDQVGSVRLIPDYVARLGLDECVHWLLEAPPERDDAALDFIDLWAEETFA